MRRITAAALAALLALALAAPVLAEEAEPDPTPAEEEAVPLPEAEAEAALAACIDDDMTDIEKLTALHDWLALHCDYGATKRSTTAYGALAEHTANCVGYAEGYAYLAALAGLDGVRTYSEELDHAWILTTLDGERYFSDCTWDDGKNAKLGLIRHRYFLFGERTAESVGHYGWDSEETVPGGVLEAVPWREAVTRVIFDGDWAYYIDGAFRLWRCDRATLASVLLWQSDERWPDPDPDDGWTPELYTSLVFFGGRLFFNTPTGVYSIDTEGAEVRTVLEPELAEGVSIYGVAVRDGMFCYSTADDPDAVLYDILPIAPVRSCWGE